MAILLYHFGYRGDILVTGQNFALELRERFPGEPIDLMLRPRMREMEAVLAPMNLFRSFLWGEKPDFHVARSGYAGAYLLDELVFPEGNLRTPFTKAGFAFRQHELRLAISPEAAAVAAPIRARLRELANGRPLVFTQSDMKRKWPEAKVREFWERLDTVAHRVVLGPEELLPGANRPLTFLESAGVLAEGDLFCGVDSGIAHGAALVGLQTILIPPVFSESWISPTSYANPFITDAARRHVSLRPPENKFCGHYQCLRSDGRGRLTSPSGNPLEIRCDWNKRFGFLKGECCFLQITPAQFFQAARQVLLTRGRLR